MLDDKLQSGRAQHTTVDHNGAATEVLKTSKPFTRFNPLSTPTDKMPQCWKNTSVTALPDPAKPPVRTATRTSEST